jgi:polygalacturonase
MQRPKLFLLLTLLSMTPLTPAGSAMVMRASLNVHEFGATGNGRTKDTAAFQKALDACLAAGGGEVLVPAGEYLIGSIEIKSNTTLRLSKDAHLIGSPDLEDYPVVKVRWEGRWIDGHRGLVYAQNAHHIAIIGPGKISGSSALGGRQMPRRPVVIEPMNSTDIRLEDFSTEQRLMW